MEQNTKRIGPSQRDLLDARSDAIGKLSFPDADDAEGWKKQRALLAIVRGLNRFINKETVK